MNKRVVVGNDHGAVELKARVVEHLRARGFEVADVGVSTPDSVDYPDMAAKAVEEYRKGGYEFGVVLCGTGIGISIAANKFKGIRCALLYDLFSAEMAKAHNDANFIALGGRMSYPVPVEKIIDTYIDTKFLGDRHARRVEKLNAL
jgi:ribose 5-phosphate isomerase B